MQMQNFNSFGLHESIMKSLDKNNFSTPTQIQAKAIPVAISGKDVIATAQTGTGKTLAFGIPLVSHLLNNTTDCALVMTPTRELAAQVVDMFKKIIDTKNNGLNTALLVGGDSIMQQITNLKKNKPRLIVGTPGRINDHINRKSLSLKNARFLVLDEMDRMLDMGFSIAIDEILEYLPEKRQTLMFSATLPNSALSMAKKYLVDPVRIEVEQVNSQPNLINQETIKLSESEKYDHLLVQLDQREGSIIVFVKTKINADKIAKKLQQINHIAVAIHGDLRQSKRNSVIKGFREKRTRIMIATDVAARGLDIPHIEHVINYDLPHCAEDYVHRIGRTGRAGASGSALNLVTPSDERRWIAIDKLLNPGKYKQQKVGSRNQQSRSGSSKFGSKNNGDFKSNSKNNSRNNFEFRGKSNSSNSSNKSNKFTEKFVENRSFKNKEFKNAEFKNKEFEKKQFDGVSEKRGDLGRSSANFDKKPFAKNKSNNDRGYSSKKSGNAFNNKNSEFKKNDGFGGYKSSRTSNDSKFDKNKNPNKKFGKAKKYL